MQQQQLPVKQYPASDYDPRMVNTHRMRDVQAENTQRLSKMLTVVLQRAQMGEGDDADSAGAAAGRFHGYSPEDVYRTVLSLTVLENTAELTRLLDAHFDMYAADMKQRLIALHAATLGHGEEHRQCESGHSDDVHAEETDKKRRRLTKDSAAVSGPLGATDAAATAALAAQCFSALVRVWRRLVSACEEIQTVWAPFANRYVSNAASHASPGRRQGLPEPAMSAVAVTTASAPMPAGATRTRLGSSNVLAAAVPALGEAVGAVKAVLAAATEGYVAAIVADVAETHPVPTGPSERRNEEEEPLQTDAALHAQRQRQADIKAFTDFTVAIGVYMPMVQAAVVSSLREYYSAAAASMRASEVPCRAYFIFAQEALALEKARAAAYLHPHTSPLLVEVVEGALLGQVGMEVVSRDFAELFAESACAEDHKASASKAAGAALLLVAHEDEEEGRADDVALRAALEQHPHQPQPQESTLALVWRLLSRCAHVPRDPVVQCFKSYIEEHCAAAVKAVVASVRAAATPSPSPTASLSPSGQHTGQEATKDAVSRFLALVRRTRLGIARCFTPDRKTFLTPLDEALQRHLEPRERLMAEVLAAFADQVFKRIEAGALPLTRESAPTGVRVTNTPEKVPDEVERRERAGSSSNEEGPEEESGGDGGVSNAGAARAGAGTRRAESGEETLALVAFVCTHLPSMDLFGQLHWRDMGRRLLHPHRVANLDAERCFLKILKNICGNTFVSKFEGMIRDLSTSTALTEQYEAWVESRGTVALTPPANASSPPQGSSDGLVPIVSIDFDALPKGLKVQLQFMTDGLWPPCVAPPIQLRPSMQRVLANVEQFYHRLYAQRIVRWQHQLSHGVLRARLKPGVAPRQLSGTLIQCLMLLCLDERLRRPQDSMSVEALCHELGVGLETPEVMGALLGLCHERFGLLLCDRSATGGSGDGGGSSHAGLLCPQDRLRINDDFVFPSARVRIPFQVRVEKPSAAAGAGGGMSTSASTDAVADAHSAEAGAEMSPEEESRVLRDEGHMIQIAVIRFMKGKGKAKHEELVRHLQSTKFSFTMTVPMVKKTLDRLMDRGFIERKGADVYAYLA